MTRSIPCAGSAQGGVAEVSEELEPSPSPPAAPSRAAGDVRHIPVDAIVPCPIQPRVNISVELVRDLARSIQAGTHDPVIEVEALPGEARYQIICGEQRWRAAREAGLGEVLALVRPPLGYFERFLKQSEENRLRAGLDPIEEAHSILLAKTLHDIERAEQLLAEADVEHTPLAEKRIRDRAGFAGHLAELQDLLIAAGIHTMRTDAGVRCRPLTAWRVTERALGISESQRKQKVGILRLAPDVQEQLRRLPAEHAIQISRLDDHEQQVQLAGRAAGLTHREVRQIVDAVRKDPDAELDKVLATSPAAPARGPIAFTEQLQELEDLGRQLVRRLRLMPKQRTEAQTEALAATLANLRRHLEQAG